MPDSAPSLGASPIRFGVFELDPASGELRKSGALVRLKPQSFKVLALLAARPGQVVTRDQIQREVWGESTFVDFEQGVNHCIKQIRTALGDDADRPRFVETLPRRGYRFLAPVESLGPAAPASVRPVAAERRIPAPGRWVAVAAGLALLLGASVLLWPRLRPGARAPGGKVMLAVLPFENLSGDAAQEYLSDGLTEEMITQLGRLHPDRLGVIARTSAMAYKGARKTAAEVARELGVDYILEGSVRRAGDRMRVNAQLIEAADQTHLWAESYERDLRDVLAVQSEVATAVAREVRLKLTPQQRARLTASRPIDPGAYELYLKARHLWNRRTDDGLTRSAEMLEQAIRREPTYALAHAGLAEAYTVLVGRHVLAPAEGIVKGEAAARRALDLDDSLAEAHAARATFRQYAWDWAGAEAGYRRALEHNPSYAMAHAWYAESLMSWLRTQEALAEVAEARRLDPLSLPIRGIAGMLLYRARRYGDARREVAECLELDPQFATARWVLGLTGVAEREFDRALPELRQAVELSGGNPRVLASLGHALGLAGRDREARKVLAQLHEMEKTRFVSPVSFAIVHAGLGQHDQAIGWLEKAVDTRNPGLGGVFGGLINLAHEFDGLRDDPRFAAVVRRVGLPPGPPSSR